MRGSRMKQVCQVFTASSREKDRLPCSPVDLHGNSWLRWQQLTYMATVDLHGNSWLTWQQLESNGNSWHTWHQMETADNSWNQMATVDLHVMNQMETVDLQHGNSWNQMKLLAEMWCCIWPLRVVQVLVAWFNQADQAASAAVGEKFNTQYRVLLMDFELFLNACLA